MVGKADKEKTTIWITKYALTSGIEKVEAEISASGETAFWGPFGSAYGEGKNWHRTEEEAKIRAEEMRKRKIASLKKSLVKLEKAGF